MPNRRLSTLALATASIVSLQLVSSVTPLAFFFSRSFNISFIAPALANTPQYVPPASRGTPKRTTGGGARGGCLKSIPVSITLLVPNDHVGQTALERPSFSWYVSNPTSVSVPMQFALVEPGVARPLLVKSLKAGKTGLEQLEIPQNAPKLQSGHQYRWTVSVICNTQRPSENLYVMGWVKRVTATANQAKAIALAGSDNERALVYARTGLWYDALTAMSRAYQANPQNRSAFESFVSLLDEVGLTQVAIQERKSFSSQYKNSI